MGSKAKVTVKKVAEVIAEGKAGSKEFHALLPYAADQDAAMAIVMAVLVSHRLEAQPLNPKTEQPRGFVNATIEKVSPAFRQYFDLKGQENYHLYVGALKMLREKGIISSYTGKFKSRKGKSFSNLFIGLGVRAAEDSGKSLLDELGLS